MAKPDWLRVRVRSSREVIQVKEMLKRLSLHTVCEEAGCPNIMECFGRKTATFMILGRNCTRNCTFCNVTKNAVDVVDPLEPMNIAKAVLELDLHHVVITSVTRDDLSDGGANHFAQTIKEIHDIKPSITVEVLIPDFKGDKTALKCVIDAKPQILNHNIETVKRLYPTVRPMAIYERSLELLKNVKVIDSNMISKSGIMLGLGEKEDEVIKVLEDLREVGCDVLSIGQYLAPSKLHHPVFEYINPEVFEHYKDIGMKMGFKYIASAPLVRSSYHAEKALL